MSGFMEVLIIWIIFALIGYAAAKSRGWNPFVGVVAGLILGPLSFLLFLVSGVTRGEPAKIQKRCRECAEMVQAEAKLCRYCGSRFDW